MITKTTDWVAAIQAPSREVQAMVIINAINQQSDLKSIKVEKIPTNGSFFGYSICQKATIELFDKYNDKDYEKGTEIQVYFGVINSLIAPCKFYVDEVVRDEVNKTITITAYDLLHTASQIQQKELEITLPITLSAYANKVAEKLGTTIRWEYTGEGFTDVEYTQEEAPNFNGTETLRDVLNGIAGATGSICFMDVDNKICMRRLYNAPVYEITKDNYFELSLGKAFTLTKLTHATELGDNYTAGTEEGFNQVLRDNPFLENRTDIAMILDNLLELVKGTTLYHYSIKWRANPAIEIGDCVSIDGKNIFYLGETIKYTGGMSATSEWKDTDQEHPDGNPTTIGQAIVQTFAKVDKVNNKIELVAGEASDNASAISQLQLDTNAIRGSVSSVEQQIRDAVDGINGDIETLTKKVEATMTDEDVQLKISEALSNGISEVTTTTGFTFNKDGLTVSKTGSEMTTNIDEDGMSVFRDNVEVLTADNTGVKAINLHAQTYLIIGTNSRLEDYTNMNGQSRTGCFWIGG